MTRKGSCIWWAKILLASYLINPVSSVFAQRQTVPLTVNLPAGELVESLDIISKLYGISFIADAHTLSGKQNITIRGHYTLSSLLSVLLAGLHISYNELPQGIILKKQELVTLEGLTKNIESITILGDRFTNQLNASGQSSRTNLEQAIAHQYDTIELGEYISANGLSALPSHNLAEALGHLPGISISRFLGEGLTVSARGLGPLYQSTLVNGQIMAANENVRTSGQFGRSFRFEVLSPKNIAAVNIIKSPSANMYDNAIGSTINIETFKPLQLGNQKLLTNIGAEYSDKAEAIAPQLSVLHSNVSSDNKLGILLSANYHQIQLNQQHFQTWNWQLNGNGYQIDTLPVSTLLPSNRIALTDEREKRNNFGVNIAAQWHPTKHTTFDFDYLFSGLEADYLEQRLLARLDKYHGNVNNSQLENNTLLAATFDQVLFRTALETSKQQHLNQMAIFESQWIHEDWIFNVAMSLSHASSETDDPIRRTRFDTQAQTFSYNLTGGLKPRPLYSPEVYPTKLSDIVALNHVSVRQISMHNYAQAYQFSAHYPLQGRFLESFYFGLRWRNQTREYSRADITLSEDILQHTHIRSEHTKQLILPNFLNSYITSSDKIGWLGPNENIHTGLADILQFAHPTEADKANSYGIEETTINAYFRMDFEFDNTVPIRGNFGVNRWYGESDITGLFTPFENHLAAQTKQNNNQSTWLPSVNVQIQIDPQWQLKFGLSRSFTLPSFDDFNPGLTLNSTDGVRLAQGGNPNLKAIKASQWDAGLYWYFDKDASVYMGVFAKYLNDFIGRRSRQVEILGENYQLTQPSNQGKASIQGLELAYQQSFAGGFGTQMSVTLIDSEVNSDNFGINQKSDFEQVSQASFNLTAFYEQAPWSLRLGLEYRSDYLDELSVTDVPSTRVDNQRNIQFNLGYQLTSESHVSFTMRNLLAKPLIRYFDVGNSSVIKNIEDVGGSFSVVFIFNY